VLISEYAVATSSPPAEHGRRHFGHAQASGALLLYDLFHVRSIFAQWYGMLGYDVRLMQTVNKYLMPSSSVSRAHIDKCYLQPLPVALDQAAHDSRLEVAPRAIASVERRSSTIPSGRCAATCVSELQSQPCASV
jgi:hypothetical protein